MQIGTFSIRRSNRRHRARSYTTRPPGRATNKVRSENRSVEGVPSVTTNNLRFAKRGDLLGVSCKVGLIGPGRRFATKRNPTTAPFHCGMPLATRRAVARRRILCRRHQSVVQRLQCPTGPGELRSPPADFAHQRMETVNRLALGLAHEFNNVLQIVHGYISSARGALPFESEPRQDLEAALRATNRAAELASRLLQFTRAQDEENRAADISDTVVATKLLLRPNYWREHPQRRQRP